MLRSHTRFDTSGNGLRHPPSWSLFRHFRRENLAASCQKWVCYRPPSRRRLPGNKRQKYKRGAKGRDPKIIDVRETVPPAGDEIFGGKNEISSRTGRDRPGPHGDRNPTTMSFPRRTSGGGWRACRSLSIFRHFGRESFTVMPKKNAPSCSRPLPIKYETKIPKGCEREAYENDGKAGILCRMSYLNDYMIFKGGEKCKVINQKVMKNY